MELYVEKLNADAAKDILSWQYDPPYDFYNNELTPEAISEMLEEAFFSVLDADKQLIGFFCVGSPAQVPNDKYTYSQDFIDVGLGMKPELTGQGNGTLFFTTVLNYINERCEEKPKRLTVAKFNDRAIRLYEKLGFSREAEIVKGTTEFIIMICNENDNLASMYERAKPGEIITFGAYPQMADGADQMPIKWRVLQNSGRELFILSEYILDCRRYHGEYVDVTWHDSDLRKWLNDEFYNAAFNDSEHRLIKTTQCTDNGEGSINTEDKIFLLSVSEANEFTFKLGEDTLRAKRRAVGTGFSKEKKNDGCKLYVYDKKVKADYILEKDEEFGCSWWWLRTQPAISSRAYFVGTRSSIRSYGHVNLACYGVRPALILNLQ
ncbi:GNAT family N-acetyltransferase [Paenibacillus sp. FSL H8-0260]|uniref:GNAT family N-acetyltransferase n=1 Tax=Paenibacillus sp. FSL H8-0260 TaxID=2921380 RepID=UPI00324F8966